MSPSRANFPFTSCNKDTLIKESFGKVVCSTAISPCVYTIANKAFNLPIRPPTLTSPAIIFSNSSSLVLDGRFVIALVNIHSTAFKRDTNVGA